MYILFLMKTRPERNWDEFVYCKKRIIVNTHNSQLKASAGLSDGITSVVISLLDNKVSVSCEVGLIVKSDEWQVPQNKIGRQGNIRRSTFGKTQVRTSHRCGILEQKKRTFEGLLISGGKRESFSYQAAKSILNYGVFPRSYFPF